MNIIKNVVLYSLLIISFGMAAPLFAQSQEKIEIVFTEEMTLRALAQEYFGNPNDWNVILRYNGLESLADLKPDMRLSIPIGLYARTIKLLDQVSDIARSANMEGAGVLATESIAEATRLQAASLEFKNNGQLNEAHDAAQEALQLAQKALTEAQEKKIQDVSAVLAQKEGAVQSRQPKQPVWLDTEVEQELIEQERVRTLSASRADILFVDGSKIDMSENSLAVIGAMRENVLKRSFKAEVTVLEGDILAHLSSLGGQKEFTISAPGIQTTIRSTKFRTSRDASNTTRIANYDGEIDVEANQGKVTVGKDEGTKIEQGKAPEAPRKLLPPPAFISPTDGQTLFSSTILFEWNALQEASAYHLEISPDRKFTEVIRRAKVTSTQYEWIAPPKGVYYSRIYSIDPDEFAGPYSEPFGFYVDLDTLPPFLTVSTPTEGEVLLSCDVQVQGSVETQATLMINAETVIPDDSGAFSHPVSLEPGEQTIIVTAADAAGNVTTIQRKVVCNTATQLISLDTPQEIITNLTQVTITGEIRPHTRVEINGEPVELPQKFSYVLTLPEGRHAVNITAFDQQDNAQTIPLMIQVDLTSPIIMPDKLPSATQKAELVLSGSLSEPVSLTLNGTPAALENMSFELPVTLQEGDNQLLLEAVDAAGNVSANTIRLLLDTTAPTVTGSTCAPTEAKGGDIISCQVTASDSGSGLARTGRFTVVVAPENQTLQGVLTLNRQTNRFEGSVFTPPDMKGKVQIQELTIQDRLGNEAGK